MSPPGPSRRRASRTQLLPPTALRRHRRQLRHTRRHRGRKIALGVLGILVALIAGATVTGAGIVFSDCSLSNLKQVTVGANSFVYAADGSLLGAIPAVNNSEPVSLARMSSWMPKAVVAIEDRRFYEHGGIDYVGIVRAAVADVRAGKTVQGGSTITQQLVRLLYSSDIPAGRRTVGRKLKEVCLARKLDEAWSKQEILTAYINDIPYGNRAYGVEAAAQTYFSKRAAKLNLPEAAMLAGLPQAPTAYDPFHEAGKAIARRNEVLRAMLVNGDIDQAQYRWARRQPLKLKPGELYTRIREPYFFSYVREELIRQYGEETVRSGGLRVYTTINPRYQRLAERAIRQTLTYRTDPAAAVVAIDPRNGAIRGMTSVTPGQPKSQFNLVAQSRRQAGSTFKTFVLTSAIEQGMNPYTTSYLSAPFHYQPDPQYKAWDVHTYSNSYSGWMTVEQATLASDNTVFAQLTLDADPAKVADMAWRLGVRTSHLPIVPSIGLGSASVSPLEMASAYATIAAGGIHSQPMAITRVVFPDGQTDKDAGWGVPKRERVIPDWVAAEVTKVLGENIRYGTGAAAYFGYPSAGKTGTTDDHADAWFCGITPQLSTTVWVGYPQAEIPMNSVHGIAVAGGTFPAQIWRMFMQPAIGRARQLEFPVPVTPAEFGGFVHVQRGYSYQPSTSSSTSTGTTSSATTSTASTTKSTSATTTSPARTQTPPDTLPAPPPPPSTTTVVPPPVTTPTIPEPPPTTDTTITTVG
ncbi:MAG: transglycosylase domain-containing protein [Gaiellaceae bacterium]